MSIVLVATQHSYRIRPFIEAANRLGQRTFLVTNGENPLVAENEGCLIPKNARNPIDLILRALNGRLPEAVLASDDSTVELAHQLSLKLNLPVNSPIATKASINKFNFRSICQSANIRYPKFHLLRSEKSIGNVLASVSYPCVAKPVSLSASRGVIRCDNELELKKALERIKKILYRENTNPDILIEDFITGREFAVEAIAHKGFISILAIFEKPDQMDGPYFEETIYITPPRITNTIREKIEKCIYTIAKTLGFFEGPIHAELRVNNGQVIFLEIASRTIGGKCGKVLEFLLGRTLEEVVLSSALDIPLENLNNRGASGVMMIPVEGKGVLRRVEGIREARQVSGIVSVQIDSHEGEVLEPWPEGGSYPGFIFARSSSSIKVERALRQANDLIKFVLAPYIDAKINS